MPHADSGTTETEELRHSADAQSLQLDTMPVDGCRWVFRGVAARVKNTGSEGPAHLRCVFVRIPDGIAIEDYDPYRGEASEVKTLRLNAGLLPQLRINLVFVNGLVVGVLEHRSIKVTVDASAGKPSAYHEGKLLRDKESPTVWFAEYPATLGTTPVTVQLPCAEIVRATMAPTSHFARSLLSGPASAALAKLVDPAHCFIDPADFNHWRLYLRHLTASRYAQLAGMYLFNPAAAKALACLHPNFIAERGKFKVPLPFSERQVELDIYVHPNADLRKAIRASAIVGVKRHGWVPPRISVDKPYSGLGQASPPDGNTPSPFQHDGPELNPLSDPITHADGDPDRSSSPNINHLQAADFALDIFGSVIESVAKRASVRFQPQDDAGELTNTGSSGDLGDREGSVARVSLDQLEKVASGRFAAVLHAFAGLESDGHVSAVQPVSPEYAKSLEREGVLCWPFKTKLVKRKASEGRVEEKGYKRKWGFIDVSTERIRTALAMRFEYCGHQLCWLEIDVRLDDKGKPRENFVAMLFRLGDLPRDDVEIVVRELDKHEGRIRRLKRVQHFAQGKSIWAITHAFEGGSYRFDQAAISRRLDTIFVIDQVARRG